MSWIVRKRPAAALPLLPRPEKAGRREDDRDARNPRARKGKRGKVATPNAMKHGFNKPAAVR
jgi:translation initiation factor IF-2